MSSPGSASSHPDLVPSRLDPVVAGGWSAPRYSTGLRDLDARIGGLGTGELWVITAAAGQGRSTLLTQFAVRLAVHHHVDTWLISNRDAATAVAARAHALTSRVPLSHLQDDRVTEDERPRLDTAHQLLDAAPLHVIAGAYAAQLAHSGDLLTGRPLPVAALFDDPSWRPGWTLAQARALADTGTTVVVTLPRAQVLPGIAYRCDLEPDMVLPDVVMEIRLHNLAAAGEDRPDEPGLAAVAILRNRRGPYGTVPVVFQGHFARFIDETRH